MKSKKLFNMGFVIIITAAISIISASIILLNRGFDGENIVFQYPVQYQRISHETARAMMDEKYVIILDVRARTEFDEGHIENAVLIPHVDIERMAPAILTDKNQIILVYCRTGVRSEIAARELIELGYTRVYDFGGILGWPYGTVVESSYE